MKMRITYTHCIAILLLAFYFMSCGKSVKQESTNPETNKLLKFNSAIDEQKKQKSKEIAMEIWKQLNFIPDMDHFINIINHFKDNHLFVNADGQGYIIVAVSNKGFKQVIESEQIKLIDTSRANVAYQLDFLIHHIVACPRNVYPGIIYRSLAGEDLNISDNRANLSFKDKTYPIVSSLKMSDDLEIIAIDSVLYR